MADLREVQRALSILDEEEPDPVSVADWVAQLPVVAARTLLHQGRQAIRAMQSSAQHVYEATPDELRSDFRGYGDQMLEGIAGAEEALPEVDPRVEGSTAANVVSGVTQLGSQVAVGATLGLPAAVTMGGLIEGQEMHDRTLSLMRDPTSLDALQKAETARIVGLGVSIADAVALGKMLGFLNFRTGGRFGRVMGLLDRTPGAVTEGLTEGGQSMIENMALEHLTERDLSVLREGLEEGLYGGAAYQIVDTILGTRLRRGRGRPQEPLSAPVRGAEPEGPGAQAEPRALPREAGEPVRKKERDFLRERQREASRALPETPEERAMEELLNEASDEEFRSAVERMSPEETNRLIEQMGRHLLVRGPELEAAVEAEIGRGVPALEAEITDLATRPDEAAQRLADQEEEGLLPRGFVPRPTGRFVEVESESEGRAFRMLVEPGQRPIPSYREAVEAREAGRAERAGRLLHMQAFPGNLLPSRKKPRAQVQTDESFGLPDEWLRDKLYRKLADKFAPIKRLEETSERAGMPVLEHERGYQAEELFSSRAKARLDEAERTYLEPIKRHLTKRGVTLSRVDDYLTAIVAPEVNRVVSERRGREVMRRLSPRARKRIKALESAFGKKEAKLNTELVRRQKALERRANLKVRRLFSRLEGRSRTRANRLRRRLRVRLRRLGRQYQEKLYAIDDAVEAELASLAERGKTDEQIARAKRRLERRAQEKKELAAASYRRKVLKVENRYFRDIEDVDRVFGKRIAEAEQRLSQDVELREARELVAAEVSGRIEGLRRRRLERLTKIDAELGRRVAEAMVNERRGAGMTDADAALVREEIESGPRAAEYREIAALIRRVNDQRLDLMVRYELISQETADEWRELYPNYVPLRSFSRNLRGFTPARTGGRGFSVRGPESKRRRGRISRADSPLIFSLLQLDETIIRGEKNLVDQKLVQFFDARPSDHWTVTEGRGQVEFDELTGQAETPKRDPRFQLGDTTIGAKFRGREVLLTFDRDSELLVRALKGMNEAQAGDALKLLQRGMRALGKLATAYNPGFLVINPIKDVQTAAVGLQSTRAGQRAFKRALNPKNLYAAGRTAYEALRTGEARGPWGEWWTRYRMSGAKIDWYYSETAEERLRSLTKEIEKLKEGNASSSAFEALMAVGEWIEDANGAIENAIRFSAFRALVEDGMSEADAASEVKNLTVNFTRKGEWGKVGNMLYLFWQAGIGGTATMFRNIGRSRRVQAIVGAMVVEGFVRDILNRLLSDRDENGDLIYDTIPDWIKEHNFILMLPGQRIALMFPYSWGYSAFANAGRVGASTAFGETKPVDGALSIARGFIEAFNPLGGESTLAQMVSPTLVDPIIALGENRSFAGTPIMRENYEFGFQRPKSALYWNSTGPLPRAAAKTLNEITGGDEATSGRIDVSPDMLEHVVEFFTSGAGKFVSRLTNVGPGSSVNDIPIVRRFVWEQPEWQARSRYYEHRHEIEQAKGRVRFWERQIEEGIRVPYARQKLRQSQKEDGWLLGLDRELRRVERELRRTDDEAERRALQQAFNRLVNEAKGNQ